MATEYIDTSINPADYIEVWEVEDAEHGKQLVMAVDDLKCLPPADVRPVRRGRWTKVGTIENTWAVSKCSACGYQTIDAGSYCPNCGAEMRGDEDG